MKAIIARKRRFTADFDNTSRLVSTENKLEDPAGQTLDVLLKTPSKSWPCALEQSVSISRDGQSLATAAPVQMDVTCME